jgi:hypothetical protein
VAELGVLEGGKKAAKRKKKGDDPPPPPPPPTWQVPSEFPADASATLRKGRISKKQFSRYIEQLTLFMLTHFSADYAISLQDSIRRGDKAGMEMFAKMMGLVKNEAGVVVNMQNNLAVTAGADARGIDALVRQLDERDRRNGAIDVSSNPLEIE